MAQHTVISLGLMCLCTALTAGHLFGMNAEEKLFHDLISGYSKAMRNVRPVKNHTETLVLSMGCDLVNINKFDSETGEANFLIWDKHSWKDSRLTWNPAQYDNIESLRVPVKYLWQPDVILFNSLLSNEQEGQGEIMVVVSHDGSVLYIPPRIRHVLCDTDDFKTFTCNLKFGSWTYNGNMCDLQFYGGATEMDLSHYTESKLYKIMKNEATREVKQYDCCPEPYVSVTFTLVLQIQ